MKRYNVVYDRRYEGTYEDKNGEWVKYINHKQEMELQKLSYESVCDEKDKVIEQLGKEKEWLIGKLAYEYENTWYPELIGKTGREVATKELQQALKEE